VRDEKENGIKIPRCEPSPLLPSTSLLLFNLEATNPKQKNFSVASTAR